MKYSSMKNIAEKLVMPEDMKIRIITNCKSEISQTRKESFMKKNNMFINVCTVLAATGVLEGFFRT